MMAFPTMNMQNIKKAKAKHFPLKVFAMFIYIYSVTLVGLLSGEVLAMLIGIMMVAFINRKFVIDMRNDGTKAAFSLMKVLLFVGLYGMITLFISRSTDLFDNSISKIVLFVLLYGGVGYLIFVNWLFSTEELFKVLYWVTLIQSLIILAGILSPDIAKIIDNLQINKGQYFDYSVLRIMGYHSGIACITSTGSLQLSVGIISCVYFILKKEKNIKYIISFGFFTIITTAVSRTGLAIGLAALIVILLSRDKKKYIVIGWILILLLIIITVIMLTDLGNQLSDIFVRLISTKEKGLYATFFGGYFQSGDSILESGIPPISFKTLIGTGITRGTTGNGVFINADGGFFRLYASIGLPFAVLLCCILLFGAHRYINKIGDSKLRIVGIVFIVVMVIGEFKEPFVLSTRYMLVLFLIFLTLVYNDQRGIRRSIGE